MNKHRSMQCRTVKETCLFSLSPLSSLLHPCLHFFNSFHLFLAFPFLSTKTLFFFFLPAKIKHSHYLPPTPPSSVTLSPSFSFPLWPRQWQTLCCCSVAVSQCGRVRPGLHSQLNSRPGFPQRQPSSQHKACPLGIDPQKRKGLLAFFAPLRLKRPASTTSYK